MLLGVFEPLSLGGEVVNSHLQDSKARRLQEEQHTRGSRGLGNSPPGIGVGIASAKRRPLLRVHNQASGFAEGF